MRRSQRRPYAFARLIDAQPPLGRLPGPGRGRGERPGCRGGRLAAFGSLGDLLRHHQNLLTRVFGALTIAGLAFVYCLGLGIPFVVAGLAFHRSMAVFAVVKRHYRAVMIVGGGLLVATGILEITGLWNTAVQHLQTLLPGSTIL
ncbi:MAG: hypothetical protein H0V41_17755 [Pseudonocardiales bacterium]|nr:hypothetical protein [Pseudonocardiales bacterium]